MNKSPNATLPFGLDWSRWLANEDGDSITSATWTVPAGLTKVSDNVDGGKTIIWLSGGVEDETYELLCHIVTAGGRQEDETLDILVQSRGWP